jgi:hypothetical protein
MKYPDYQAAESVPLQFCKIIQPILAVPPPHPVHNGRSSVSSYFPTRVLQLSNLGLGSECKRARNMSVNPSQRLIIMEMISGKQIRVLEMKGLELMNVHSVALTGRIESRMVFSSKGDK